MYIYICVCVCVCVEEMQISKVFAKKKIMLNDIMSERYKTLKNILIMDARSMLVSCGMHNHQTEL